MSKDPIVLMYVLLWLASIIGMCVVDDGWHKAVAAALALHWSQCCNLRIHEIRYHGDERQK